VVAVTVVAVTVVAVTVVAVTVVAVTVVVVAVTVVAVTVVAVPVTVAQVTVAQVTVAQTVEVMGLASALAAMAQAVATASEMADPMREILLVVSRPEKGTVPARPVRSPEFPLARPPPAVDLRAESRTFPFFC
ncbi:MAG: hypothetical protein ACR2L3_03495, partial [Actinomycetota bacterium]